MPEGNFVKDRKLVSAFEAACEAESFLACPGKAPDLYGTFSLMYLRKPPYCFKRLLSLNRMRLVSSTFLYSWLCSLILGRSGVYSRLTAMEKMTTPSTSTSSITLPPHLNRCHLPGELV